MISYQRDADLEFLNEVGVRFLGILNNGLCQKYENIY